MKRKTLPVSILNGEVPGTLYSLGDSSWINSDTFDHWFSNHFLVHVPPVRLRVLSTRNVLDGVQTLHTQLHYNPELAY